jgi:hypothetical protein
MYTEWKTIEAEALEAGKVTKEELNLYVDTFIDNVRHARHFNYCFFLIGSMRFMTSYMRAKIKEDGPYAEMFTKAFLKYYEFFPSYKVPEFLKKKALEFNLEVPLRYRKRIDGTILWEKKETPYFEH